MTNTKPGTVNGTRFIVHALKETHQSPIHFGYRCKGDHDGGADQTYWRKRGLVSNWIWLNFAVIDVHEISEIELELTERKQVNAPRLILKLSNSDVKTNATVALNNLLPLTVEEILSGSERIEDAESIIDTVVSQGKAIMKNKNTIVNAVPEIDGIVEAMDRIAQVRLGEMNIRTRVW